MTSFLLPAAACLLALQAPTAPETTDPTAQARQEFQRGRTLYDQGLYAEAARRFQRAFELSARAELLFNIGQAARLAGDCDLARDSYQGFVDERPEAVEATESKQHIEELTKLCPTSRAAEIRSPPPPSPSPSPSPSPILPNPTLVANESPRASAPTTTGHRTWVSVGLVAGGAAAGLLGGGFYLHNGSRQERWQAQDSLLRMAEVTRQPGYAERQRDNDQLARSIATRDRVAMGLVAGGLALVTTGIVYWLSR